MNHRWQPEKKPAHDRCVSCKVLRRTVPGFGQAFPITEYLVNGIGWTRTRPECFRIDGQESLFADLQPPAAVEPPPDELALPRVHPCAVPDCGKPIRLDYLMCAAHWRLVPLELQRGVQQAWARVAKLQEYGELRRRAVDYVVHRLKALA